MWTHRHLERAGNHNKHPNVIKKDWFVGCVVLVWRAIILSFRSDLHTFKGDSVTEVRYCNAILLPHVPLFIGSMGPQFLLTDDNASYHHTVSVKELLERKDIESMG